MSEYGNRIANSVLGWSAFRGPADALDADNLTERRHAWLVEQVQEVEGVAAALNRDDAWGGAGVIRFLRGGIDTPLGEVSRKFRADCPELADAMQRWAGQFWREPVQELIDELMSLAAQSESDACDPRTSAERSAALMRKTAYIRGLGFGVIQGDYRLVLNSLDFVQAAILPAPTRAFLLAWAKGESLDGHFLARCVDLY